MSDIALLEKRVKSLEMRVADLIAREDRISPSGKLDGNLTLEYAASQDKNIEIQGGGGYVRDLRYSTGASLRWILRCNADAEEGSNAGSNFALNARDDAGASLGDYIRVSRATGQVHILNDLLVDDNIFTEDLVNWFSSSTKVGWSDYSTNQLSYHKIGHMVYVQFQIVGTSNSGTTSFTVPYTNCLGYGVRAAVFVIDDGGTQTLSYGHMNSNSNVFTVYKTLGGGGWTASGTKAIRGQFWYHTNE